MYTLEDFKNGKVIILCDKKEYEDELGKFFKKNNIKFGETSQWKTIWEKNENKTCYRISESGYINYSSKCFYEADYPELPIVSWKDIDKSFNNNDRNITNVINSIKNGDEFSCNTLSISMQEDIVTIKNDDVAIDIPKSVKFNKIEKFKFNEAFVSLNNGDYIKSCVTKAVYFKDDNGDILLKSGIFGNPRVNTLKIEEINGDWLIVK